MTKTKSEICFEKFCSGRGIEIQRIPEGKSVTPDYEIHIDGLAIVAEVKEIERNKEELESDRLVAERGYGNVLSNTPGDRVRKKINSASPQIKSRSKGESPGVLVLYDEGLSWRHLDPYNIKVAMYGLEQIHIAVPRDLSVSPYSTGNSFGPKRKMTEEHNTSISAVAVLFVPRPNEIELNLFHNAYAAIPLRPEVFAKHDIDQYRLGTAEPGATATWEPYGPTAM